MNYLFNKFNIKIKTVAPYTHQSLQAEHGIKSLSIILSKHLTNLGQMWPNICLWLLLCITHLTAQICQITVLTN